MSYKDSIDFWVKWHTVPIDKAIILAIGEEPHNFRFPDGYFDFLKALAINHANSPNIKFRPPSSIEDWLKEPVVFLVEFGEWFESLGHKLPNDYPRTKALITSDKPYVSKELTILNQAAREFWSTADPDDASTHPKQQEIIDWLRSKDFSKESAKQGAVIIRTEWAAKGRRSK